MVGTIRKIEMARSFSFEIVSENFKVCDNDTFDCKVLWKLGQGEWNSVGFFVLRLV